MAKDRKNVSLDMDTYEIYYLEALQKSTPKKRVGIAEVLRAMAIALKKKQQKHEAPTLS